MRLIRIERACFLSVLCVAGVVLFLTIYLNVRCLPQTQLTEAQTSKLPPRFSTTDELLYTIYGVGDQFSVLDQHVIQYIRSHIAQQSLARPRQLSDALTTDASQFKQSTLIDQLLSGRRQGFFVECGAAGGEIFSNSLFFEVVRNWTGILIEANPGQHRTLLEKNRHAYVLNACLGVRQRPETVRMQPAGPSGGIVNMMHPSHVDFISDQTRLKPEIEVNCFPLNSIMAALDISHVDYFSLDVEGPELEILRTIDWTQLEIDVIQVEYRINGGKQVGVDQSATIQKLADLRNFFNETKLYREVALWPPGTELDGVDAVFMRI